MDLHEAMKQRHAVRKFTNQPLDPKAVEVLLAGSGTIVQALF